MRDKLYALVQARMPFGKYAGRLLMDLPEAYLVWFSRKGFPPGALGTMMELIYEIKLNGLEYLLEEIRHFEKVSGKGPKHPLQEVVGPPKPIGRRGL